MRRASSNAERVAYDLLMRAARNENRGELVAALTEHPAALREVAPLFGRLTAAEATAIRARLSAEARQVLTLAGV